MKTPTSLLLLLIFFILSPNISFAQKKNISQDIIQKGPKYNTNDLWKDAPVFQPYEGKIIKSIKTIQLDFEFGIENTDNELLQQSSRFLDKIHIKTRPAIVEKNLFIHVGDRLKPYLLADNERFLRTIPYIQDARIVVVPLKNTDSIDLIVYTKDIFVYSGMIGGLGPSRQKLGISNINLLGTGQEIGVNFLHDKNRNPLTGMEGFYDYHNILGTFLNSKLEIGTVSPNLYDQKEDELSMLLSLDLPLISQYKRWAGGIEFAINNSKNLYPDLYNTGIYYYKSGTFDTWLGYNIGAKKYLDSNKVQLKKFIALRYFNHAFFENPNQIGQSTYDQRFNANQGLLTSITLFKQYYFKTNYIYGFGNTEDIPAGYNTTFTMGYYQQLNLKRPYFGLNFYNYALTKNEDLTGIFLRTGAFYHNNSMEDIGLLLGGSVFSRILSYKEIKIRNYFRASYGTVFNRIALDPLRINNVFGLYGFQSDLAKGGQRLSFRSENYFFLPFKIKGFNIAPISIIDCTWLGNYASVNKNENGFFFSLGAGVRFKNENLGINTIEMRLTCLPRKLNGDKYISFSIITDLDFKYRGNYITKPRLIEMNTDFESHIF